MKTEIHTERHQLAQLRGEWDALARQQGRDGFFRSPAWYESWIDCVRPDAKPYVVTARDAGGKLLALAPLCRLSGLGGSSLRFAGAQTVSGDFLGFLHQSGDTGVDAILARLWQERSSWSVLTLCEILEGDAFALRAEHWACTHGLSIGRERTRACYYVELPDRFEAFVDGLGERTRRHLRQRMRELFDKQHASLDIFSTPAEAADALQVLIRLHLVRWQLDHDPGTLGQPALQAFLLRLCSLTDLPSDYRMYVLRMGEEPLAAALVFHHGNTAYYYQAGWNPLSPLARRSPGMVLLACCMRDAIEHGLRYFEFLRGDDEYKQRWCKKKRHTVTLVLGRTALARARIVAGQSREWGKQTALQTIGAERYSRLAGVARRIALLRRAPSSPKESPPQCEQTLTGSVSN